MITRFRYSIITIEVTAHAVTSSYTDSYGELKMYRRTVSSVERDRIVRELSRVGYQRI